jgi:hypothetical protein
MQEYDCLLSKYTCQGSKVIRNFTKKLSWVSSKDTTEEGQPISPKICIFDMTRDTIKEQTSAWMHFMREKSKTAKRLLRHTSLPCKFGCFPRSSIRMGGIQHQDGVIPNTQIRWLFFNLHKMTDERDPSILYIFLDILPINYTTPKLTQ